MKLPIIVSAGMISATVAYNAYALTCGAQPSCDSLGYKYTGATTDCLNEPLKCPFNSSYFNCVKKLMRLKTWFWIGVKRNQSILFLQPIMSAVMVLLSAKYKILMAKGLC